MRKPEREARLQSTAMVKTPAAAAKEKVVIKMKAVTPVFQESDLELVELQVDLDRMGCVQLMSKPWALKSEYMIREILVGGPYKFKTTLQARPSQWTALDGRAHTGSERRDKESAAEERTSLWVGFITPSTVRTDTLPQTVRIRERGGC